MGENGTEFDSCLHFNTKTQLILLQLLGKIEQQKILTVEWQKFLQTYNTRELCWHDFID